MAIYFVEKKLLVDVEFVSIYSKINLFNLNFSIVKFAVFYTRIQISRDFDFLVIESEKLSFS